MMQAERPYHITIIRDVIIYKTPQVNIHLRQRGSAAEAHSCQTRPGVFFYGNKIRTDDDAE
eukprot:scaffold235719_cov32-Prasinocladus_malaysianus.AAC.2